MKKALLILIPAWLLASCSKEFKGDIQANQAPESFTIADTIQRSGDTRFRSVVEIRWWGTDPDGFVKGYEISFDAVNWTYTTRQDSVFTLNLPGNSDTADFRFYVRAIDNEGAADPTPAMLGYPVKNSNPDVSFIISSRTPLRSFPALKYVWQGSDPDGDASLDYYELVWNDTTQSALRVTTGVTEATFVADDITGTQSACSVYPGVQGTALTNKLPGLLLNSSNILYVRSVDKVGAKSAWKSTPQVFVRKPVSDILFINGQQSAFNRSQIQNFYLGKVNTALGKAFDTLQAGPSGSVNTDLSVDPATQDRVFSFFKKIFVYSEDSEFILSLLQRSTTRYFQNGGKLMVITEGNDVIQNEPPYLDFTPIARYSPRPDKVSLLFNLGDSLKPLNGAHPSLRNGNTIVSGIRPFEVAGNNANFTYQALYNGMITQDSSGNIRRWTGNSTLMAKRFRVSTGQTDFVICLFPVYRLQNNVDLDLWFRRMLVDELNY